MRHASIAAAFALALAIAGPVAAGQQLPFRGTLTGTATTTPLGGPIVAVRMEATGTATHLGAFTVVAPHVVNQATMVGVGTYLISAANGDTITADFTGTATLASPPNVSISETVTVTGGTGRFAGATGTIQVERTFNHETGVTSGTMNGWISLSAS